jgi:SAM-dependent methyltransferase
VTPSNQPTVDYPFLKSRAAIWREIVRYVRQDAGHCESVLELGTGYGDFIRAYPAKVREAWDINPAMALFADPEVRFLAGDAVAQAEAHSSESFDLIFASNFLEHLTRQQLARLLPNLQRMLKPRGQLILLQPNFRLASDQYFADPTHRSVFSDTNIDRTLSFFGFGIRKIIPDLLPFSMKSRGPKWPLLVRLYMHAPIRPMGAQMYVVASREA